MGFINLGRSGAGNDQILAKTLDAMLKEKDVGLVVLMWSEWQRIGFQRFKTGIYGIKLLLMSLMIMR